MKLINAIQQLLVKNDKWGEEEGGGGGGWDILCRESLIEDLQYLAILLMKNLHTNTLQLEHLHLNADLSFLLKCTEFSIDLRK